MIIDMVRIVGRYLIDEYEEEKKKKIEIVIEKIVVNEYHILKIKPKDYLKLSEKEKIFSQLTRYKLFKMGSHYTTRSSVIKKIPVRLIVSDSIEKKLGEAFVVPLDKIIDYCFDSSFILGENVMDVNIYKALALNYLENNEYRNKILLKFNSLGGGGAETANQYFYSCVHEKKFGICIVDSDKLYPEAKYGETAKKVLNYQNKGIGEIVILEMRELENMIPIEIFEKLFCHNPDSLFNVFEDINIFREFYNFVDLKYGMKTKNLFDPNCYNYWKEILSQIKFQNLCEGCKNNCLNSGELLENIKNKTIDKDILIFSGYGRSILERFLKYLNKEIINDLKTEIERIEKMDFEDRDKRISELTTRKDYFINSYKNLSENPQVNKIIKKVLAWGCYYEVGIKAEYVTS